MTGDETAAVVARIERCAETCESKGDECAPGSHDSERQHAMARAYRHAADMLRLAARRSAGARPVSALDLAVAEVEALAADYAARADRASPTQEEIMRAFAANLRHLAARIRALPHLARGGTP